MPCTTLVGNIDAICSWFVEKGLLGGPFLLSRGDAVLVDSETVDDCGRASSVVALPRWRSARMSHLALSR